MQFEFGPRVPSKMVELGKKGWELVSVVALDCEDGTLQIGQAYFRKPVGDHGTCRAETVSRHLTSLPKEIAREIAEVLKKENGAESKPADDCLLPTNPLGSLLVDLTPDAPGR